MKIRPLSQCNSNLNFAPKQQWSKLLPVLCRGEYRLCGFQNEASYAVELDGPVEEILFAIYPNLSFVELSRLYSRLKESSLEFGVEKLFGLYGYHWNQSLRQAVQLVFELPPQFQEFALEKDLSPRALEPLNLKQDMGRELEELANLGASKSEAVQIIELVADLKMLGRWPDAFDWNRKASDCLDELRSIRFPKRTAMQNEVRLRTKKLSWPKGSKWKWNMQSDQNTLDLQLSLKSIQDLEKLSSQFEYVSKQASSEESNPWQ